MCIRDRLLLLRGRRGLLLTGGRRGLLLTGGRRRRLLLLARGRRLLLLAGRGGGGRRLLLAVAGGLLVLLLAGVAEDGVQRGDHVDRVAAEVHRHVDRDLGGVAGAYAGRAHGGPVRARAGRYVDVRDVLAVLPAVSAVLAVAGAGVGGLVRGVLALVAEGRVQRGDHVDGVAAGVHRHVDRYLDGVAGRDARRVLGGSVRMRVGKGGAAAQGKDARRGGCRDHPPAQGLSHSGCLPAGRGGWSTGCGQAAEKGESRPRTKRVGRGRP